MAVDDITIAAPAAGTLSRPNIAAAAAPRIRKPVSAIIVMVFDREELRYSKFARYQSFVPVIGQEIRLNRATAMTIVALTASGDQAAATSS
jgi:hypothetical protein